ncbi:MAG: acetate--CoA ligase family protein [Betaproteobacteria bacterium]|nr:acetate--CoA ligase family protein [Betaproteobacteria bacterium]
MQDPSALGVFFRPRSIALVGASSDPKKPGNTALRNMISLGYKGKIYPLHPREQTVLGLPCHKSVLDIPAPLDLCVLLVSAELSVQVARELAERKKRFNDVAAVVCMSAGFGELDSSEARQREKDLVQILKSASIRLIGPNCLGVMDTDSGFNTNFDIGAYPRGGISVLTQSGAFGNSFLLWAGSTGRVGLNKFVSIGNMADVDMAELLAYWKTDESTRAIGIYLEGLSDPKGFFQAARDVAAVKPIVLLKSGRSEKGTTAALSHTGAVAGADAIYDGALKQAGVIRAKSVSEFYDTLRAFGKQPIPAGGRVCVLTHMGGPGTLCIDEISALASLQMADFSSETDAALKAIMSPSANVGRPGGYIDTTAAHYENLHNQALKLLFQDRNVDAIIQILAPSAFLDQKLLAKEIASAYESQTGVKKPLLNVVTFGSFAEELRQGLENAGLPTFDFPDTVARVAANMAAYAAHRRVAAQRAPETKSGARRPGPAAELIATASKQGRISLLEPEAYEVCRQYDIPVPPSERVETLEGALRAANAIGYPVVLKIVAAEILHKTEAGGVMLGVNSDSVLEQSYGRLIENVRRAAPNLQRPAVLVQKMMPSATELVLGAVRDKLFGPAVMFGLGGIYVEVLKRVGFRLAPLGVEEAKDLINDTLPPALIAGARGRKKINVGAIALALASLGRLLEEQPQVEQIDLNPCLPIDDGFIAVDARIIISK